MEDIINNDDNEKSEIEKLFYVLNIKNEEKIKIELERLETEKNNKLLIEKEINNQNKILELENGKFNILLELHNNILVVIKEFSLLKSVLQDLINIFTLLLPIIIDNISNDKTKNDEIKRLSEMIVKMGKMTTQIINDNSETHNKAEHMKLNQNYSSASINAINNVEGTYNNNTINNSQDTTNVKNSIELLIENIINEKADENKIIESIDKMSKDNIETVVKELKKNQKDIQNPIIKTFIDKIISYSVGKLF